MEPLFLAEDKGVPRREPRAADERSPVCSLLLRSRRAHSRARGRPESAPFCGLVRACRVRVVTRGDRPAALEAVQFISCDSRHSARVAVRWSEAVVSRRRWPTCWSRSVRVAAAARSRRRDLAKNKWPYQWRMSSRRRADPMKSGVTALLNSTMFPLEKLRLALATGQRVIIQFLFNK